MKDEKEKDIQSAIIEYLRLKRYVVFKHHSTGLAGGGKEPIRFVRHGEKGISDIIACSPTGQFCAIEVKRPKGGKASVEQLDFIERVKACGGIAFIAKSIDDVMDKM